MPEVRRGWSNKASLRDYAAVACRIAGGGFEGNSTSDTASDRPDVSANQVKVVDI